MPPNPERANSQQDAKPCQRPPTCGKRWTASGSNAPKENALPANHLPLEPQYQHWVDQLVMTEPEAHHLQFLMEAAQVNQTLDVPPQLEQAVQNLALHSLVDEETAMRH